MIRRDENWTVGVVVHWEDATRIGVEETMRVNAERMIQQFLADPRNEGKLRAGSLGYMIEIRLTPVDV